MEIKKATPEKVYLKNEQGWDSKYGKMYDHVVKFPGSDIEFIYTSKSKEQDKFKAGVEVEFEYEKKEGDTNGVHWEQHKIKPVSQNKRGGSGGYSSRFPSTKEEFIYTEKVKTIGLASSYIKDLVATSAMPVPQEKRLDAIKDYIQELSVFMMNEIDKVK